MDFDFDRGQHMLIDEGVLRDELGAAEINGSDRVLEIGAGSGFLTKKLALVSGELTSFEIDEGFREDLENLSAKLGFVQSTKYTMEDLEGISVGTDKFKLVFGDALDYSWKGFTKVVSNVPYHLSERIVLKGIVDDVPEMVLIVGEKFKEKLDGKSKVGFLSNLFYEVSFLREVERRSFNPPPRVNSWLIKLVKKEISPSERFLLNVCFSKGKIKNVILKEFVRRGVTKNEGREKLKRLGLSEAALEKPVEKITYGLLEKIISRLEV